MLYRKIASLIEAHLQSDSNKILLIDGARQVGKTYIVRYVGQKLFENYIEINLVEDALGAGLFANVRTVEDFYLQVSMLAGDRMKEKENTLIFLDEIQAYPHLLTMLKFLAQDGRFTYIASGSLLGVTLAQTPSIPMGSIRKVQMFPLDFEEFLYANGLNEFAITAMRRRFEALEALDEATHNKVMDLFRKYLLVGGLPDAVNTYLAEKNIQTVREIQREIHDYYAADASKYGEERKLMIRRIYDLIPSNMENKKKRVVAKSIEDKKGKTFRDYSDEFEYLISAGIALPVQAISNPVFPLIESAGKNLLKLYLNDVGLLTCLLYGNNIRAVLDDEKSINLGSVYETVVASELAAHGYKLYYYDNRSKGEVDYLIDDYSSLSAVPLEVKSGKDYTVHSALNTFVQNEDYHIKKAFVLSNERKVSSKGKITYLPIYYADRRAMAKVRRSVSPPTVRCNNCPLNTNIGATGLILKERGSYMGSSDFLHYKGYSAKADYSAEDRIFYGTILGISDMVEFQSENAKDLEDEFHQAVDEYLEFCKEIGKDPQKE